jgi:hypothetical protein
MSEDGAPPVVNLTEYERELVRKAQFGNEIEHFVEGMVGQYLFGLAGELESACDAQLRTVDPTNLKAIVDLQVRARAATFMKEWLLEAVRVGLEAQKEIADPEGGEA